MPGVLKVQTGASAEWYSERRAHPIENSNRLSSLNCWRLSVPRYLSCSNALRAANDFKMGARARSARMRPCDRLLHAVTMPAAIGTKRFLLIGVASLLHAKATEPPPYERKMIDHQHIYMTDRSNAVRVADRIKLITLTSTG